MPRSLQPYIDILEGLLDGRISPGDFRSRTIQQYDRIDSGVDGEAEWDKDVEDALEQMDGDAEVIYYPEAPEESYISLEELHRSSRENLRYLLEAVRGRSGGE